MIEWKVIQLYVQMFLHPIFLPFSLIFQPFENVHPSKIGEIQLSSFIVM